METILSHIIPVAVLLGVTLLSLAAEAVLKRKKDLRPAYRSAAAALAAAVAGAWQQAPGMKTPWGEKVTPENAWREYPRPQMVRENWENLNGLWQYAVVTNELHGTPERWDG